MPGEPRSTYRLQINVACDLNAAANLVPYLDELGIDCAYLSPYLQAAPGSTHGYDVVDHSRVNQEWGGEPAFERLCSALAERGMGQVIDIVPNHMAIGVRENPWWWDVLENGPASAFAASFDVDWDPPDQRRRNIVLLHTLEDHYGTLLASGGLKVVREGAEIQIEHHDQRFPAAPRSIAKILSIASSKYFHDELAFVGDALNDLPIAGATDTVLIGRRHRDRRVLLAILSRLLTEDARVARIVDLAIEELNSDRDALHDFLERQNYRLAYWRLAAHDVGYRRFFDINTLVGLRMENERVFRATHDLVAHWTSLGLVRGIRVDHPDGLRHPAEYFDRLRAICPDGWIVIEKILAFDEPLRSQWPVDGTTGYDFANLAGGLFVDPAGEAPLTELYIEFTGETADFPALARDKKMLVMRESLGGDVNRLAGLMRELCENDLNYRDFTRRDVEEVLQATLACFGVYRTYVCEPNIVASEDRCHIRAAIAAAKRYRPDLDQRLFDFLGAILELGVQSPIAAELAMRFQQTSAATMAKGVEDTAFYNFNRFIALNEVGGAPDRFGVSPEAFHSWCAHIARNSPRTMLATSTHDTKRSEDVRARLYVLSEMPEQWRRAVARFSARNKKYRTGGYPDRNIEYNLYQTIVGAWPIDHARILECARKTAREAKAYTSWTNPNKDYEDALEKFVGGIFDNEAFLADAARFADEISYRGRVNSLALTLLKLVAPGVPDFYQGCELWNLALVDPDNRRPVDFDLRRRLLAELKGASVETVMRRADEGLPKLWLITRALELRSRHPDWFAADGAGFAPLRARGSLADHVIAIRRGDSVIAVAPRLMAMRGDNWAGTVIELPAGGWINHLTGEQWKAQPLALERLLGRFPVALLARSDSH